MAFWVDGNTGMIIDFIVLQPGNIWNEFQSKLVEVFRKLGYLPATIRIDSRIGIEVMDLYCDRLGIDLIFAEDHPVFQQVKNSMRIFF